LGNFRGELKPQTLKPWLPDDEMTAGLEDAPHLDRRLKGERSSQSELGTSNTNESFRLRSCPKKSKISAA